MSNPVNTESLFVAEEQIYTHRRAIDYDTREFTIEIIVKKFLEKNEDGLSDIYLPEHHKPITWDVREQSLFIESIILGLPVPAIFVAEIEETGRLEILEGSTRVRILADFITNKLQLQNLTLLDSLNGFYFKDLLPSRQSKFKNTWIRTIVLSEKVDETVRKDVFNRLNYFINK